MQNKVFINRRKGRDRREEEDLCEGLDVDVYHRKRRKNPDRRAEQRSLDEDYQAFMNLESMDTDKSPSQDQRLH